MKFRICFETQMEQKVEQQPEKGDTRSEKGVSTEKKI
jgi:hypothetical protein